MSPSKLDQPRKMSPIVCASLLELEEQRFAIATLDQDDEAPCANAADPDDLVSDIDDRVVTHDVAAVGGQRVDVASEELDELVGQEGLFGVGDLSATAAHGGTGGTLAVGFVEPVVATGDRDAGGRPSQQRAAPRIAEWSSIVRPCRRSSASV